MTLLTKNYKHRGHVHCWTRALRIATCTWKQWVKTPALMFLLWNVASDYSLENLIFERCLVWQVMPCMCLMPSTKVAAFKNVLKKSLLFNLLHWEEEADWHHVAPWTLFLGTQEFVDKDYGALGVWIWFSCVESRLWVWQENNRLHQGLSTCFPPRCYSNLSLFLQKETIHSGVKVNWHNHHRNRLGSKILMDLVEFAASCWLSKGLAQSVNLWTLKLLIRTASILYFGAWFLYSWRPTACLVMKDMWFNPNPFLLIEVGKVSLESTCKISQYWKFKHRN